MDHGYYSAMILLRWYGLVGESFQHMEREVAQAAGAILLHNFYGHIWQKLEPELPALKPERHPLAFLLILSDELQEWNRQAYGIKDKQRTLAAEARLEITEEKLAVTYITHNASLPADFASEKKKLLYKLLDMGGIFDTVSVRCKALKKSVLPKAQTGLTARPALNDLEKLARAIHELYNEKQLERYPDKPLKYPDFNKLSESLKYSNLRQAMDIPEKLKQMGFVMSRIDPSKEKVEKIPTEYVEYLTEREHEAWVEERKSTGWVSGNHVDAEKKITPYLVAYKKLPDEIKQLDRDPVENIPVLLSRIGMAVYKREA